MTFTNPVRALVALSLVLVAMPAAAQEAPAQAAPRADTRTGAYAVLRAGIRTDADLRVRTGSQPATLPREVDLTSGFTGAAGIGYDLGGVRLEGTLGLSRGGIDGKRLAESGGRFRSLDLDVAGYVDLARGPVRPFVGAGIGASRVRARLEPLGTVRLRDGDWGFHWHLDAGVGAAVSPTTTVELGVRYQRVSGLRFDGGGADVRSRLSGTGLTLGLRQAFR